MLKPKLPQTSFFISGRYLYDRVVPSDHLLRKIDQAVDFSFVHDLVRDRYTPDFGRPAEGSLFQRSVKGSVGIEAEPPSLKLPISIHAMVTYTEALEINYDNWDMNNPQNPEIINNDSNQQLVPYTAPAITSITSVQGVIWMNIGGEWLFYDPNDAVGSDLNFSVN